MNRLSEICARKKEDVAHAKSKTTLANLESRIKEAGSVRGFAQALENKIATGQPALITEIKKASPSAGLIRPDFDPAAFAKAYESGGAACLSVLTDGPYFQGSESDFHAARAACAIPMLRKDFMIDVWQITEARAMGADCILLIMAALDDAAAKDLHQAATAYGMDVLIETHDEAEIDRALSLPTGLIGINNRNLKTMQIDLATTQRLAPRVPVGRRVVGESGIKSPADIKKLAASGVKAFLIGEHLMRQQQLTKATRELVAAFS